MSTIDNNNPQKNPQNNAQTGINLKNLFFLCLGKWPYFVLSIGVALVIAVAYIASTPTIFQSYACVVIKQDRKTGNSGIENMSTNFSNMGNLFASQTNVNNEILAFQSPSIMNDVVTALDLRANYTTRHLLYDLVLYGPSLPCKVNPVDFPQSEMFEMNISKGVGDTVLLSNITTFVDREKMVVAGPIVAPYNETVETPIGRVVVVPNPGSFPSDKSWPEMKLQYVSQGAAVGKFKGCLSASLTNKDATAVSLVVKDQSPARAREILESVITMYNKSWVEDRNLISVSTAEFIDDRLNIIMHDLSKVDGSLSTFKANNRILDPKVSGNIYLNQETKIQNDLFEMRNSLAMAEHVVQNMRNLKESRHLIPANTGIDNVGIESQIAEYNKTLLKLNNLISNSSANSPVVINMEGELSAMRDNLIASIENYIVTLKAQIKALQYESGNNTLKISSNPKQTEQLTDIERQQKVKESLYLFLLQKREENELSKAFTAYNTRVISAPSGGIPVAPRRKVIFMIAFLMGLALPLGIIYLIEVNNTTVRSRKDLEQLSLPFLGEIPLAYPKTTMLFEKLKKLNKFNKNNKTSDQHVVAVQPQKRDVINEAFRVVRSNVEFICDKYTRVVETTSFNVGSGKTFISVNLASALAIKGLKVCSVDLDLRKATLSEYVGNPRIGVRDFLAGRTADIDEITVKGKIVENFDVIPVGIMPPNPSELLYSDRLDALIAELRTKYDFVFLDCPPAEIVADSLIVNRCVDRTLFVVRAELMERDMLPELEKFYKNDRYKGLMLLLNGTEAGSRYGYRKYGYGRYGYGYGYGKGQSYYGETAYGSDRVGK